MAYVPPDRSQTSAALVVRNLLRQNPAPWTQVADEFGKRLRSLYTALKPLRDNGQVVGDKVVMAHPANAAYILMGPIVFNHELVPNAPKDYNPAAPLLKNIEATVGRDIKAGLTNKDILKKLDHFIAYEAKGRDFANAVKVRMELGDMLGDDVGPPPPSEPPDFENRLLFLMGVSPRSAVESAIAKWQAGDFSAVLPMPPPPSEPVAAYVPEEPDPADLPSEPGEEELEEVPDIAPSEAQNDDIEAAQ